MGTATPADAVQVWHRRRVRIYDREAPLGYLLLAPTLVVLGIFLLYPFLFGIWLSITDSELGTSDRSSALATNASSSATPTASSTEPSSTPSSTPGLRQTSTSAPAWSWPSCSTRTAPSP